MYGKTHEFRARLEKLASSSCLPTHGLQNAMIHGDAGREFYEPAEWNNRQKVRELLNEVIVERRNTTNHEHRKELFRLERQIERQLKAGRLMKPQTGKSFSRCFIDAAETVLNHDVFMKIKAMALEKCGAPENEPSNS